VRILYPKKYPRTLLLSSYAGLESADDGSVTKHAKGVLFDVDKIGHTALLELAADRLLKGRVHASELEVVHAVVRVGADLSELSHDDRRVAGGFFRRSEGLERVEGKTSSPKGVVVGSLDGFFNNGSILLRKVVERALHHDEGFSHLLAIDTDRVGRNGWGLHGRDRAALDMDERSRAGRSEQVTEATFERRVGAFGINGRKVILNQTAQTGRLKADKNKGCLMGLSFSFEDFVIVGAQVTTPVFAVKAPPTVLDVVRVGWIVAAASPSTTTSRGRGSGLRSGLWRCLVLFPNKSLSSPTWA
jgi:hypothetical protein